MIPRMGPGAVLALVAFAGAAPSQAQNRQPTAAEIKLVRDCAVVVVAVQRDAAEPVRGDVVRQASFFDARSARHVSHVAALLRQPPLSVRESAHRCRTSVPGTCQASARHLEAEVRAPVAQSGVLVSTMVTSSDSLLRTRTSTSRSRRAKHCKPA